MHTYEDTSLRCNDCGVEIPLVAIAGPDGTVALTVEEYLHLLHLAGYDLFCEVCLDGREVEWQLTPGQSADHQPKRAAAWFSPGEAITLRDGEDVISISNVARGSVDDMTRCTAFRNRQDIQTFH
jgi:hypothetical protein